MKREAQSTKALSTKNNILEATAQILLTHGIESANTNVIADRAGVSIGSLYQYYSCKEDIFEELLKNIVECRRLRIQKAISEATADEDIQSSINKVISTVFTAETERETRLETLLLPLLFKTKSRPTIFQSAESLESATTPLIKSLLIAKKPKLTERNLDAIIFVLIQSIRGVYLATTLPGSKSPDKEVLKKEVEHLLNNYLS